MPPVARFDRVSGTEMVSMNNRQDNRPDGAFIGLHTPQQFRDPLPVETDVVVIGGGVIGVCAARYLALRGLRVCLVEKGRIAGEQSSRNWGWVRQHGRDEGELPVMMEANRLWGEIDAACNGATGFRREGVYYLASSEAELAGHEAWLEIARRHQLATRILTRAEVESRIGGGSAGRWIGATVTENDARAEPWKAVPAMARLASEEGVLLRENCAVRMLDMVAGRVGGVITEAGRISAGQVVLAGGAWSSLFLANHGVHIPQLSVRSTVARTAPMASFFEGNAADEELAFRRREDGSYTLAVTDRHEHFIGRDSLRSFFDWLPVLPQNLRDTRLRPAAPKGFPGAWGTRRRWSGGEETPFERCRVLDPQPDPARAELIARRFGERFPAAGRPGIVNLWSGMIDAMPDVVPIVDHVPNLPGLFLATGMSGHGFGIGPAFGRIMADLLTGRQAGHDMSRFRFARFSDGSPLVPGPAL